MRVVALTPAPSWISKALLNVKVSKIKAIRRWGKQAERWNVFMDLYWKKESNEKGKGNGLDVILIRYKIREGNTLRKRRANK